MLSHLSPRTPGHGFALLIVTFVVLFVVLLTGGYFIDQSSRQLLGLFGVAALIVALYGGWVIVRTVRLKREASRHHRELLRGHEGQPLPAPSAWVGDLDFSPLLGNDAPGVVRSVERASTASHLIKGVIMFGILLLAVELATRAGIPPVVYVLIGVAVMSVYASRLHYKRRGDWPYYNPQVRRAFAERNHFMYAAETDLEKKPFGIAAVRILDRIRGSLGAAQFSVVFYSEPYRYMPRRQYAEVEVYGIASNAPEVLAARLPKEFRSMIAATPRQGGLVFTLDSTYAFDIDAMQELFLAIEAAIKAE